MSDVIVSRTALLILFTSEALYQPGTLNETKGVFSLTSYYVVLPRWDNYVMWMYVVGRRRALCLFPFLFPVLKIMVPVIVVCYNIGGETLPRGYNRF